ncbi:pinensin family lanthipeptide [Chitinophaga nivalis]|uniref:Pinensin family lanthipeptide n=1 Tax=Chitinophaga nivalis TaxID=2991709 RepID=A0ABT3II44_9BACT|nr:pinensin family lanthipeptide [Chitinophaga nivalis]MCW3466697.1 pinensin family lanthipeptide [Chitinophaga nivalis]MCW3483612.1 pinensin family lanthipeptide [Chitinophaga nivalis]
MEKNTLKLNLEDLKIESFVTSLDSEMNKRLAGGLAGASHPTHTEPTDDEHPCTGPVCQ